MNHGGSGVDDGALKDLEQRVAVLERDLGSLRNEFSKWMGEVQNSLNLKLEKVDLDAFDAAVSQRLDEVVKALHKEFANKLEVKKTLKLLEK